MRGKAEHATEGTWDDVTRLIGQAHFMLHKKGIVRIQTDIRIGSRYGGPELSIVSPTQAHRSQDG